MNKILLLAAGVLALTTACDNGDDDSSGTGSTATALYCMAENDNADMSTLQLSLSNDGNQIVMTEMDQPDTGGETGDGTGDGSGDSSGDSSGDGTGDGSGDGSGDGTGNENEENSSVIPEGGLTFVRDTQATSGSDTATFTSASEGTTAMTLTVDQALLEGNQTGDIKFNNQTYNCSTDPASVNGENNNEGDNSGNESGNGNESGETP